MKKTLLLLWALMVYAIQGVKAQDPNNPFVHCIVLDKTLSMTGHGGNDIWAEVQEYCYELIDGFSESSTVLLFTFDEDVYGPQVFELNSDSDKEKAKEAVKNIRVDGRHTWITSSLDKAMKKVYDSYPKSQYNCWIYMITDGVEEQAEADFSRVLRYYDDKRGDFDYLYYVDLNGLAPETFIGPLDENPYAGYGVGFAKFLSIMPLISRVNCVLGSSLAFEQHFLVSNEELFTEMSFDLKVDTVIKVGEANVVPNVSISPSRNICMGNTQKMEDGKYKIKFNTNFLNNSTCECDVYVSLTCRKQRDKVLCFQPRNFIIQVRNKTAPKVIVKNGGWITGTADSLKQDDQLVKTLELEFDDQAREDDVFITWELSGDWDQFDYSFSQGTLKGNVYTIRANEYKDFANGNEGIALTIKGKEDTPEGKYNLAMHVNEVTDNLDFEKETLNAEFQITYILPPPMPWWQKLIILAVILSVLGLLIAWLFSSQAKFPRGMLQLGKDSIMLKGKKEISVKAELEKMGIQLEPGTEIVFYKKRFATFNGPCVKEIKGCVLERNGSYVTKGTVILPTEDVTGLTDEQGNEIVIRYI